MDSGGRDRAWSLIRLWSLRLWSLRLEGGTTSRSLHLDPTDLCDLRVPFPLPSILCPLPSSSGFRCPSVCVAFFTCCLSQLPSARSLAMTSAPQSTSDLLCSLPSHSLPRLSSLHHFTVGILQRRRRRTQTPVAPQSFRRSPSLAVARLPLYLRLINPLKPPRSLPCRFTRSNVALYSFPYLFAALISPHRTPIDESQAAFASQYPSYRLEIEMMWVRPISVQPRPLYQPDFFDSQRSMDATGGLVPKQPVGLQTPSAQQTEATAKTLATPRQLRLRAPV